MKFIIKFLLLATFVSGLCFAETSKPSKSELCYLSAPELIQLFQSQTISPVDLLKAQIERIEALNLNSLAITEKHYEEALAQALESEARYKNGNPRSLEGITCAIKDDLQVKGWRCTMGSLILANALASIEDSPLITKLRDAGLVMHVQTNVPEFFCNLVTWNKLWGVCRNPWNTTYTPGGSSGGGAAALALGFTTLAMGSDMGGSIRFPAAMTGLYGFKPPYGRVATSLTQYESSGPLARTFEDLNVFQNALAGPSPKMISSLKPKLEYPLNYGDIKGWRIAYDPMDQWGVPVDETVKAAMKDVVEKLKQLGAEVIEVDLGFRSDQFDIYALGLLSTSMGPICFALPQKNPDLITPYIDQLVKKYAPELSPKHLVVAEELIYKYSNEIQEKIFTQGFKAIIMPTMCTPYVVADLGNSPDNNFLTINGKLYDVPNWCYSFTWPWNLLGQYPVVNVPIGKTKENIPLGMQIISDTYDDLAAFQIASQWSNVDPKFYKEENFPNADY